MAKQQRERITERSRPTRKVVGEDEAVESTADPRNPIVIIAGATLALTLVLGMWSFFTAEPMPAAPPAPAIDGLPEGFDFEGLDLDEAPVEVIDGGVDEGVEEGAEDAADPDAEDGTDADAETDEDEASGDADAAADTDEDDAEAPADEDSADEGAGDGEGAGADEEAPEAPSQEDDASDEDGG